MPPKRRNQHLNNIRPNGPKRVRTKKSPTESKPANFACPPPRALLIPDDPEFAIDSDDSVSNSDLEESSEESEGGI